MQKPEGKAKFSLGQTVITPNALDQLSLREVSIALQRHQSGDWGDVDKEDQRENEFSLKEGFRLLSIYYSERKVKFWIITEADRSVTTVLMPEDY